ncbi:MAG: YbaN family protein [Acidobacteriota bacterium]
MQQSRLKSRVYLAVGFTMVGLGVVGIPTPILPTTPFLLLAAYCFARSSPRWHEWLVSHRILGPYIAAFREKKGLTIGQKRRIAVAITFTLLVTALFTPLWPIRALAVFIWTTSLIGLYFVRSAQ